MLGPIEDENRAIDGEGSNEVGILWAIARLVHLARMVDSLYNVPLHSSRINRDRGLAVATNLAPVFVVVAHIGSNRLGYLDLGYLNMVGFSI